MPRVFKNYLIKLLSVILVTIVFTSLSGESYAKGNPKYASIVMDADTGMILHQRYADKKLHPASLAKMMTLLMTFEALDRGDISLRDRVVVSRHAASMIPSKLHLPVGSSIRVEDAIYALVTKSANDVAVALAEKLGATESQFAVMMTRKARSIGMSSTTFRNASGLHNPKQISTARDMAKLAQYILRAHPDRYHYFSTRNFSYRGKSYRNHNRLMETYNGMDGFKTGYIQASGFNLVASAKRNDRRIIGVVFGGRTSKTRNSHMKQLLDRGFAKLNTILVAKNVPIPERKPATMIQLAQMMPAAGREIARGWADLNPKMLQSKAFSALIGEGDFDPAEGKRLETGLLAISAVKGVRSPYLQRSEHNEAAMPQQQKQWAIQVGAFSSRVKTDQALRMARHVLPPALDDQKHATIAPLKTASGVIFRGRLGGYTKQEAEQACSLIKECLLVSPHAQ